MRAPDPKMTADPDVVREAIDFARVRLDAAKPNQAREYYNVQTVVAVKQPGEEGRIAPTAHILNEKQKLEAIMPELKN